MQLDHEQLHLLLAALAESDIQEFRLDGDDFRLEVRRNLPVSSSVNTPVVANASKEVLQTPSPEVKLEVPSLVTPPPVVAGSRADLVEVTAPMVGTFYRAPGPEEAPFVEVGSRIGVGQTVCILEAMKLMNELESEVSGEVVEVLVENGTPVEYGQVLMRVKPG